MNKDGYLVIILMCTVLKDISEIEDIGYEEYFYGHGVTLVEWANKIKSLLPKGTRTIIIEKDLEQGFEYRKIQRDHMKILGIESSSTIASVAVVEDGQLLGEYTINHTLKHSKTLMPMIQEMLNKLELKPKDIGLIAVSEGPGSFTGLRIGSATGKRIGAGIEYSDCEHTYNASVGKYGINPRSKSACHHVCQGKRSVLSNIYDKCQGTAFFGGAPDTLSHM